MTQTCIDFERAARDAALDTVLDHAGQDWREQAKAVLHDMDDREVTGEDIRLACEAAGVRPHHHNAWGAFVASLVRDGLLIPTGRYVPMKAKGSHARKTQLYRLMIAVLSVGSDGEVEAVVTDSN
jgi:hypothetical protein